MAVENPAGAAGAALVSLVLAYAAGRGVYGCCQQDDQQAQAHNRAARARYERALSVWQLLVVCTRCDGVWVPGQGQMIPVDQVQVFLSGTAR